MQDFKISEAGLTQEHSAVVLSWDGLRGIKKPLFSSRLKVLGREGALVLPENPKELEPLLRSFYSVWRTRDLSAAKKNAFDYVESGKSFAKVQLVVSVVFFLGFAYVLLNDSIRQAHCSGLLRASSQSAQAEILKFKKNHDGNYQLDLSFKTADGTIIKGKEQIITAVDQEPKGPLPVVYSSADASCWGLAKTNDVGQADWAKRRFFATYLFLFGICFAVAGISGTIMAIARLREKRPFTKEITELFQLEL